MQKSSPTVQQSFPDRLSNTGKLLNECLKEKIHLPAEAMHLLFSANRWEKQQQIRETIDTGTSIVCDRYYHSGIAYSMAKGLDMQWCV